MAFARNADIQWMIATQAPPATILDSLLDAVLTIDASGQLSSANAAAERLFGRPREELVGLELGKLLLDPHGEEYGAHLRDFAAERDVPILGLTREVLGRGPGGAGFAMELTITEAEIGGIPMLVAVARDISERKPLRELRRLADHDALTGLLNRRSFERELERLIDYSRRYGSGGALLVIDLDNFKYVNDTLGHAAGDELLAGAREPAPRPAAQDRPARPPRRRRVRGAAVRRRRREGPGGGRRAALARPGPPLRPRPRGDPASPRAPGWPGSRSGATAGELLSRADIARYAAKEAGRDRVAEFSDEGRMRMEEKRVWSERVRTATEQGLFVLMSQPIVDLATGVASQHEILLRMRGDDGELVAPGAFLDTAERFGLIGGIDRWVVRQAVRLIDSHSRAGHPLTLEVNLSAKTMGDPEFPALVAKELRSAGVDPADLIFEVTETAAVSDLNQARRFAESLTRLGCRFALDDFGAGFAASTTSSTCRSRS